MFKFSFTHKVLLTLGISVLGFLGWSFAQENYTQQNDTCNQGDLMQQAFCRADNHSTVLNLGYTKKAVGNEIIKGSIKMTLDFDPNTKFLSANQSLIVRITRIFLSLVIVLSVTMIILNGIWYISKSGSGEDPSKMRRNLLYIAIGILVSVFSVVIINVMRSIGTSLQTIATGGVAPSVVGAVGGLPEWVTAEISFGSSSKTGAVAILTVGGALVFTPAGWEGTADPWLVFQKLYTKNGVYEVSLNTVTWERGTVQVTIEGIVSCSDKGWYENKVNGMSCSSQGYEGLTCYICERPAPAGKCGTCSKSSDCGENLWCDTNDMKCHSISEVHTCEDE